MISKTSTTKPSPTAGKPSKDGRERRDYFRIRDNVSLEYQTVDNHTANNSEPATLFPESATLGLFAEFRRIDKEASQLLYTINEQNRQIAEYLSCINRKIDLLTQQLIAENKDTGLDQVTQVNLSEGGIAFECAKPLYKGSFIALKLLFLPAYVGVSVFAQIIRCEAVGDNKAYKVAAKFHRIDEQQRQLLSKQILQAQMAAKRRSLTNRR